FIPALPKKRARRDGGRGRLAVASGTRQIRGRARGHRWRSAPRALHSSAPRTAVCLAASPRNPPTIVSRPSSRRPSVRRGSPARLAAPALAFALLLALAFAPHARAEEPDFSGWRDLLQRYVKVVAGKGQPWDSRFDYQRLYVDEGIWQKQRADGLSAL